MWATTELDIVLGIDVHIVMVPAPPAPPVPTPLPHPFTGFVFNPLDWIPFFNKVRVHHFPAASVASGGNPVPKHIPTPPGMPGVWAKGLVGNDAMMLLGGQTVSANGKPMTYAGLIVLSCSCVGTPPVPTPDPKKMTARQRLNTLGYLPTSVVTPVPKGITPVLIGCPPTTDLFALAFAFAFKALLNLAGSALRAAQRRFVPRIPNPNVRNAVNRFLCRFTGDPVDVATGKVVTESIDFSIPGPIPFVWERIWYSTSVYQGHLGYGWHHKYDLSLQHHTDFNHVIIRMSDGRSVYFPVLQPGEDTYNRQEKLQLRREGSDYLLRNTEGHIYRFRVPQAASLDPQRLLSVENNAGFAIRFEYSAAGHLKRITDSAGRIFAIQTNTDGKISAILAPHPNRSGDTFPIVRYRYDNLGNLTEVIDAENHAASYSYKNHLLVKRTDRNGLSFYFEYDGEDENAWCIHTWGDGGIYNHKLTYHKSEKWTVVENSLGNKTKYYWNDMGLVIRTVDPLGHERRTRYDDDAQRIFEIDELGQLTAYYYDEFGNQTGVQYPDGSKIQMKYENNLLITKIDQNGSPFKWEYDKSDNLVQYTDPTGHTTYYSYKDGVLEISRNLQGRITYLEYDIHYNLIKITSPDGVSSKWEYDALGRCIKSIDPKGNSRERTFNLCGRIERVKEPDGNIRHLSYDAENNVIRAQDNQHDIYFEYKGFNRLKSRTQANTRVEFIYDTEENMTGIVNEHGFAYRFEFDPCGNVAIESSFDGARRHYFRDPEGKIIEVKHPNGLSSKYSYDALSRLTEVNYADGTRERYVYRSDGQLIEAANQHLTVKFERDLLGRVTKEIQGGFVINSVYDILGMRTEVQSSLGAQIKFGRNLMGDVESISFNGEGTWEADFKRDSVGLEVERLLPGGVRSRWERDKLGRPIKQEMFTGEGKLARSRSYSWDVDNRLKQIVDDQKGIVKFEHDVFGNLAAAQYDDGSFEFRMPDEVGNLFRSQERKDRKYGPAGQLLESNGIRYEYDAEGNLIFKTDRDGSVWRYEWNAAGMLRRVVRPDSDTVTFTYDALGRRISKQYRGKTTRWVWDGNNILHEWMEVTPPSPKKEQRPAMPAQVGGAIKIKRRDELVATASSNALSSSEFANRSETSEQSAIRNPHPGITTWIFEPESFAPLAKLSEGVQYSIVTDHLGTPVSMFSEHGEKVWDMDLSIYGQVRNLQGWREACPFRYPGQYDDVETGLCYNQFRYYDAEIGAYISKDPIGLLGGFSPYIYVKDPNTWLDEFGLNGRYHGRKPTYTNPGHHQPGHPNFRGGGAGRTSIIPSNAEDIYRTAIPDANGRHWYSMDEAGEVHIFRNGNDGTVHWAGSTGQGKGIQIPPHVQARFNDPEGHRRAPAANYCH